MSFRKRIRRAGFLLLAGWVLLAVTAGPASARDPFVAPEPARDAYNFPAAAGQIQLKALVRTDRSARAVLYVGKDDPLIVVKPSDELVVKLEGLRHKFRVQAMQDRVVVLWAENGEVYEIGVVERAEAKR